MKQMITNRMKGIMLPAMLIGSSLLIPVSQRGAVAQGFEEMEKHPALMHDKLLLRDIPSRALADMTDASQMDAPEGIAADGIPAFGIEQDDPRQGDPKRLEELRQRIRELKHRKLQDALGLDDAASKAFFESYRPAERDIEQLVHDRNAALRDLYRAMRSDSKVAGDAELETRMTQIRSLNAKIEQRWLDLDAKLKPVISPKQRVQLLMFEKRFNERLRKELMDRRMDRNPDFRRRVEDWQKFRERRGGGPPDDRGGPPHRPDGPPHRHDGPPPGGEGKGRGD